MRGKARAKEGRERGEKRSLTVKREERRRGRREGGERGGLVGGGLPTAPATGQTGNRYCRTLRSPEKQPTELLK